MTTELHVLAWSVVLLLAHVSAQGAASTASLGVGYNLGARDDQRTPQSPIAGRLARASTNYLETYPAFVALALALAITNKSGGLGSVGAIIWIACRVAYLPLYAFGVPVVRTLAWIGALVGIILMLVRLMA